MTNQKTVIDEKAAIFAEEIKQQFIKAGNEAKQQLLENFQKVLDNDVSNLKAIVGKTVADHNEKMKNQLQATLKNAIKQQFSGSVFTGVLQDMILPAMFQGTAGKVENFKESAGQTILDISKSIMRANNRNG